MNKKNYIITIVVLILIILTGLYYYNNQLIKAKISPLEDKKELLEKELTKSLDSALKLIPILKDSLITERNKKPIVIPRYNEKIIYISVNDDTLINLLSRERRSYKEKQKR